MKLGKTYGYLKKDLELIEQALNHVIQAEHTILRKASTQLLNAGGKRIRPVFVLLAGHLGENYDIERVKTVAVAIELIHMATLVHDDVIDEATLRRGKPTVKAQYDNRVAMYTGDYILARALETITELDEIEIHQVLSKTIVEVCIGEIEQIKDKYNWDQNLRNYLRRIKRKTAILIATCSKLGAIVAGLSEKDANKLYKYGYNIGMSYQIIDDILDFTASASELGKPAGNDLLQGNITLPILYAMDNPIFKQLLLETFENPLTVKNTEIKKVLSMLKTTGAINDAYKLSNRYLARALKELDGLPDVQAKRLLQNIAKYIGNRRS